MTHADVSTEPVVSETTASPESQPAAESKGESSRKERVLHTRVPAVLERELKRFAEGLRIPVSNLVRTILEDAMSVADAATENVEDRLRRAVDHLEHERAKLKKRVKSDPLAVVVAYQAVTLAQPAMCAKCQKDLAQGLQAHLGLREESPRKTTQRVFVCDACLPQAGEPATTT